MESPSLLSRESMTLSSRNPQNGHNILISIATREDPRRSKRCSFDEYIALRDAVSYAQIGSMVRIQLEMPEEQVAELDALMKEAKIATRKDLFNNAIALFQWAAKVKRAGQIVSALDEQKGTAKELVMPALENIAAHPPPFTPAPLKEAASSGSKGGLPRANR
jgi:cellobiose phosphorylase